jgi:predicted ATPase
VISFLDVNNFKCFEHLRLSFGSLTLLTGFNGGGRSSSIQPLLLLAQAFRAEKMPDAFSLNGSLVRLGTVGDVLPTDAASSSIEFAIETASSASSWKLLAKAGDRFLRIAPSRFGKILDLPPGTFQGGLDELSDLVFLSAVREGTADRFRCRT